MHSDGQEQHSVSNSQESSNKETEQRSGRRRPIIHVGVHKTASSWFQKYFYRYVPGYRFLDRWRVRSILLSTSPLAFDATTARQALTLDDDPPAIISDEDLAGILHNGGLTTNYIAKEIASQLAAIAPEAKVVLFVRSQPAMAASCYQQYLKEGGTGSVHRYLFPEDHLHLGNVRPLKVPRFDFSQFEFDRLVDHYDSVFGRENVYVFAFEQFARDPKAFVREFCEILDIEMPEKIKWRKVNTSYRRGLIPLARLLNLFTKRAVAQKSVVLHIPYWYRFRKVLLKKLNGLSIFGKPPKPTCLLGDATHQWIQQRFSETNRRLAERMRIDLEALGYCTNFSGEPKQRPKASRFFNFLSN
jgi:hypothetical protein